MSEVDDISFPPIVKREIVCHICNKSFKRGKDLKSHSVIHNDAKPFVCSQCPEAFKHKTSLKRHSLIHSGEKPFNCRICGKSFRQKGSLNEHSLTHTGVKPHTCEVCNMGFTTKSNYGRHLKKHLLSKPFTCSICNKGFNVRSYLTRHYNRHREIDETISSLKLKSEHKTSSVEDKDHHVDRQSLPGHTKDKLVPLTKLSVNDEMIEVTHLGLKKYICRTCNKQFNGFNNLRIHLLSHVNKKIYVCDICKSSFTSIGAFCKHKLAHSHETFTCGDFPNRSEIHLETHASNSSIGIKTEYSEKDALDKRYVCSICNRTFLKEFQFMHHSITHKYPGPYCCDICGENVKFEKLHDLHKHYEEHGEIACICYNCIEESGIDDTNLNYSKSTVFKCDVCYKCFPEKNLLRKHFPTHKNRRPLLIKLKA